VLHHPSFNKSHVRSLCLYLNKFRVRSQYQYHNLALFQLWYANVCLCHNLILCRSQFNRIKFNAYLFPFRSHVQCRYLCLLNVSSASLSAFLFHSHVQCRYLFLNRALCRFLFRVLLNACLCLFLNRALCQYRNRARFQFQFLVLCNACPFLFLFLFLNLNACLCLKCNLNACQCLKCNFNACQCLKCNLNACQCLKCNLSVL
jgi:hypothetical protein